MKKIEISKEEYDLVKRIDKSKCLKHFRKYYFIYDNLSQLKLMRFLCLKEERELCK